MLTMYRPDCWIIHFKLITVWGILIRKKREWREVSKRWFVKEKVKMTFSHWQPKFTVIIQFFDLKLSTNFQCNHSYLYQNETDLLPAFHTTPIYGCPATDQDCLRMFARSGTGCSFSELPRRKLVKNAGTYTSIQKYIDVFINCIALSTLLFQIGYP